MATSIGRSVLAEPGKGGRSSVSETSYPRQLSYTPLTPSASVTLPLDVEAATLTPDQATEISLEAPATASEKARYDGFTKLLRVTQGGSGFAVTFASGIAELGAAVASAISAEANKVTYVSFIFNSDAARWESYSVIAET